MRSTRWVCGCPETFTTCRAGSFHRQRTFRILRARSILSGPHPQCSGPETVSPPPPRASFGLSGTPANTVAPNAASGPKSTLELTRKRWKPEPSKSLAATWAMRPCCRSCSIRSLLIRRSAASLRTEHVTPESATTPSRIAALMPSFHLARTPGSGNPQPSGRWRVTRRYVHRNTWVEPSGDDGPDTTAEAASKPRCIA
ncbi:hypothetical protein SAMN04488026_11406 [Aliiruegeria lutimaris]|uniref:Uncharacterized protein n=1 Tax=Aliiruegeria lutimaris TaxID=571298 RepID=A0A1G9PFI0_9RHOB|nr:hypothetical protein SAMN04488026_11406 [Aliiruegeria lutimaris]